MKAKKKIIIFSLVFIVLTLFFTFAIYYELPYCIYTPTNIINVDGKVEVEGGYTSEGSINMTAVSDKYPNLINLVVALIHPDWKIERDYYTKEASEELWKIGQIYMQQSFNFSIKYAYEKANKEVTINEEKCYVVDKHNDSETDIDIGDQIISIDDKTIGKCFEIGDYVSTKNENDVLKVVVKKNDKEITKKIKYKYINEEQKLTSGISVITDYTLITNPKYKINFDNNESGSSGGLMVALAVYNSLVPEDITGGKIIAGTGSLDSKGNVGEIGGIEFKLKGAVKSKAEVFLVPSGKNYEEAIKLKEKNGYDIEVVEVKTFDDAIEYLENNVVKK